MKEEIPDNKFDIKFGILHWFCLRASHEVATYPYAQPSISYMVAVRAAIIIPVYSARTIRQLLIIYMSKTIFRTLGYG